MSNPFEAYATKNPFSNVTPLPNKVEDVFANAFTQASQTAKTEILTEAKNIADTAYTLKRSFIQAKKSGNHAWMQKLASYGKELMELALEFFKRAIQLALAKLVLELCAQVIDNIMIALRRSGQGRVEITSPHVHYVGNGMPHVPGEAPAQPQQQRSYGPHGPYTGPNSTPTSPFKSPFDNGIFSSTTPW